MKRFLTTLGVLLTVAAACPAKADPPLPTVQLVTASSLKQEIARHAGKVVVVNFWATWCTGCVEEFPDLVRLQNAYAAKGVVLLFVSGDSPKDRTTKVVPFLARKGAPRRSFLIQGDPIAFVSKFDPGQTGAIGLPLTYIYNRAGHRVKLLGQSNFAGFQKAVKPLL